MPELLVERNHPVVLNVLDEIFGSVLLQGIPEGLRAVPGTVSNK